MNALLNAFMFGSSNCLWNLTRPIFSIYLVKREAFDSYISNVSVNQQPIVIVNLMNDTKELLKDIDYSVGERSRDDFSKKAIAWRRQFLSYMQISLVCLVKHSFAGSFLRCFLYRITFIQGKDYFILYKNG